MKRSLCALDIGGTLAKVAFLRSSAAPASLHNEESGNEPFYIRKVSANHLEELWQSVTGERQKEFDICVSFFHTTEVERLIEYLKDEKLVMEGSTLSVTGGGAFKYANLLESRLGVTVHKFDEMRSVVRGLTFMLSQNRQVFTHDLQTKEKSFVAFDAHDTYPLMLVNIGSGVSIIKITDVHDFTRISGTCVGGGTVMGLARVLIGARDFDDVCQWAASGTLSLDLTAGDLLGDCAGALPANTLASSFGRLYAYRAFGGALKSVRKEDVARSLVTMVSYNLGYLAYLLGRVHTVSRVVFTGKYINNRSVTIEAIADAMQFYSKTYGTMPINTEQTNASVAIETSRVDPLFEAKLDGILLNSSATSHGMKEAPLPRSAPAHSMSPSQEPPEHPPPQQLQFQVFSLLRDGYIGVIGALLQMAEEITGDACKQTT